MQQLILHIHLNCELSEQWVKNKLHKKGAMANQAFSKTNASRSQLQV